MILCKAFRQLPGWSPINRYSAYFSRFSNYLLSCILSVVAILFQSPLMAAEEVKVDGAILCHGKIGQIIFSGNASTKESVFRQEMQFAEGSFCSIKDILEARQNIMDLGIFSAVKPSLLMQDRKLVLRYHVKEKHYILPLPRISRTSDGEIRLGVQLRMDNFAGLNHQLRLTSEKHAEDDGAGRTGFEHSFGYNVPRFYNSRYGMSFDIVHLEKQYQLKRDGIVYGESDRSSDKIVLGLNRRRSTKGGFSGWKNNFLFSYEIRGHKLKEGEMGPFEEGQNLIIGAGVNYDDVHLEKYRRRGFILGGDLSFGLDILGGDYHYERFDAYYRAYTPIEAETLTNINYNVQIGISNGTPFGERAFSLGSGETLRGLAGRTLDGDVRLLMNMEYLSALKINPAIRWVVFWDIANIFPRWEFKPARTENGLGAGLRWKIVSFVKLDLRMDYAFSLSEKRGYAYFATRLNF